jgi:hypothetical protein
MQGHAFGVLAAARLEQVQVLGFGDGQIQRNVLAAQPLRHVQKLAGIGRRGRIDQQEVQEDAAGLEDLEFGEELRMELHRHRPARPAQRQRLLVEHHHDHPRLKRARPRRGRRRRRVQPGLVAEPRVYQILREAPAGTCGPEHVEVQEEERDGREQQALQYGARYMGRCGGLGSVGAHTSLAVVAAHRRSGRRAVTATLPKRRETPVGPPLT